METNWWSKLDNGKGHKGSRPRCVLLVDGTRQEVAARLTSLVNFPNVKVTESDFWMPKGKPVWEDGKWNFDPAKEAMLDRNAGFVSSDVRQSLRA